jgi:PST family polysaccharide transporter
MGEFAQESSGLLKLGFAFLASSFVMMSTAYLVRIIILRTVGFEATGLYQSAWMLCGLYVGFILQAMGADFYPRLTASAHDNVATTRLVNEQARIAVLLGGPGAMATLSLAPLVIDLFYSSNFSAAVGVLRWLCLGVALRLIIWPMAIIPIAKARQLVFMTTDLTWGACNVFLTWVLVPVFGLEGAGMAFFGAYVINGVMMFVAVRTISEFTWTADNIWLMAMFLPAVGLVFVAVTMLPPYPGTVIGLVFSLASAAFSLRNLVNLVPREKLPGPIIAFCVRCRLIPA